MDFLKPGDDICEILFYESSFQWFRDLHVIFESSNNSGEINELETSGWKLLFALCSISPLVFPNEENSNLKLFK